MKTEVGSSSEKIVPVVPHGVTSLKGITLLIKIHAGIQPIMSEIRVGHF